MVFLSISGHPVCVWTVCAPDGSGIVDTLTECGYKAAGLPNAFIDDIKAQWIVTNPPYERSLVDRVITRQISRVEAGEVNGLAVLLRVNFDCAKSRAGMFGHPAYAGQIKLRFRPWWSEIRKKQPIHNFVWQLWIAGSRSPAVLFANGVLLAN